MIATGLIFLLGVLVATFVALLISPIVWRKAQRLARRDFEATIPTSASEIQAGFDRVRAEAAMLTRQHELRAADIRERAAKERAEAGRIIVENGDLRARSRGVTERVAHLEEELRDLRAVLATREEENGRLENGLRETQHDLDLRTDELDALAFRFRELTETAEERKLHIVTVETRLERVSDDLRAAERRNGEAQESLDRLRTDVGLLEGNMKREKLHSQTLNEKLTRLTARLAERDEELARFRAGSEAAPAAAAAAAERPAVALPATRSNWGGAPASSAPLAAAKKLQAALEKRPAGSGGSMDEEQIRERISDIAARVIRMTAIAEGPESPLVRLLDAPDGQGRGANGPTLAERVRLLMDADEQRPRAGERERQRESSAAE